MNMNATTMAELVPTLAVELNCANYINNLTQTYAYNPNISEVGNTMRLYGSLAANGFLGGDCGVDFEKIAADNETIEYLEVNDLVWEPDQRKYVYNICIEPKQPAKHLRTILQILAYLSTIIIMIGMGCSIDIKDCWTHLRRPWGVSVGVVCQFLVMPCIALGLGVAFVRSGEITEYQALIVLLMGCSPGGSLSNIMSIWIEGDVNLSVAMTLTSTLLSLGMIPLLLLIMKPAITSQGVDIPFVQILITLVVLLAPIAVGIVIAHFRKNWADKLQRICGILGVAAIIANLVLALVMYPKALSSAGWALWLIGALIPLVGAFCGYSITFLVGKIPSLRKAGTFGHKQYRTVALETGAQNLRLANTIVQVTFIDCPSVIEQMLFFPLIYAIFQTCECLLIAAAWKMYFKYVKPSGEFEVNGVGEKSDTGFDNDGYKDIELKGEKDL